MPSSKDSTPCVSCIGIVDFTEDAKWLYCSASIHDLLGFEPHELIGHPSLELVHPDEYARIKRLHYDTIRQDKAAVLAYLRLKHKDPYKGYVLCAVSRTVVHNVLAGSVSFAAPGPKAMHNASTAQEVTVITPTATNFEFRKWNDPSPMPPCEIPDALSPSALEHHPLLSSSSSKNDSSSNVVSQPKAPELLTFAPLPTQSVRTLLILDRFSVHCHIRYCSNDNLVSTTTVMGRSFYDFVAKKDEELVRSWIDVIKGWGVNESGQPSDGGFGFGKFTACLLGRDSSIQAPEVPSHRRDRRDDKNASRAIKENNRKSRADLYSGSSGAPFRNSKHPHAASTVSRASPESDVVLDAIFSAHSDGLMVIIRKAT